MKAKIIIFMILFILSVIIIAGYLYRTNQETRGGEEMNKIDRDLFYKHHHSDEYFQELLELFEATENLLNHYVFALQEDEVLGQLANLHITFLASDDCSGETRISNQIHVCDGEIIRSSSEDLVEHIRNNTELISTIKGLDETGIFRYVALSTMTRSSREKHWSVNFSIDPEHLSFIEEITYAAGSIVGAVFVYIENELPLVQGSSREIRDGWHMIIESRD